jgi:hypothetical protein
VVDPVITATELAEAEEVETDLLGPDEDGPRRNAHPDDPHEPALQPLDPSAPGQERDPPIGAVAGDPSCLRSTRRGSIGRSASWRWSTQPAVSATTPT